MGKNTKKHKTINKIQLPTLDNKQIKKPKKTLPFNGYAVTEKTFSFSFACFDRTHELFNLGGKEKDKTVGGQWFIELIDCLKNVSNMNIEELKRSMYDLHPIDWQKTNTNSPENEEQYEYWQFRINKSKGRVIGFIIEGVFYIVWLDPYHNLINSEGYGKERYYKMPLTYDNDLDKENRQLKNEIETLKEENRILKELLNL